jgi:hypothetical protein
MGKRASLLVWSSRSEASTWIDRRVAARVRGGSDNYQSSATPEFGARQCPRRGASAGPTAGVFVNFESMILPECSADLIWHRREELGGTA